VPQTPRRSRLKPNNELDFATEDHAFGQFRDSYQGVVTLCIGGGQGIALAIETLT
jgi:hypothetical protein